MPIRPENQALYPDDWSEIRLRILTRAKNACEFCGLSNHSEVLRGKRMVRVVLTIAHLDHDPTNSKPENLRALCQQCHNRYDVGHRKQTRARTGLATERAAGQRFLFANGEGGR